MSAGEGKGVVERLRRLDAHSSISNEFRVRTGQGAALSIVTLFVIAYLVYTEIQFNFTSTVESSVYVNATSPTGIEVEIDITFPSIPCVLLSVDAVDPIGQAQSLHIDRQHRVWKYRLDEKGNTKQRKSKFELGETLLKEEHLEEVLQEMQERVMEEIDDEEECGSCYGAGEEGECCNTCDDVKRVYMAKSWHIPELMHIKQCMHTPTAKEEMGEGCNVHGIVALSSGGGNLHFAPGRSLENFGHETQLSLTDIIFNAFERFNVSHTVNKIRFGQEYPGAVYQLDQQFRIVEDTYGMYQYYIKIVPTLYKFLNGTSIQTNQFSVTEHLRHVNPGTGRGLPGVFFIYEVSPLHVTFQEQQKGWIRFITSCCAIVGGVFTFMAMADKYIYDRLSSKGSTLVTHATS